MEKLTGYELKAGTKKNKSTGKYDGAPYDRRVQYGPGMKELTQIVAGLYKDVKRINECITLPGAQKYISKRPNWEASEADITGPNGKPDGINEVFVTDGKGNLKVINGYGLAKSHYPIQKAYRTAYPTRESRKGEGNRFSDFLDKTKQISVDDNGVPFFTDSTSQIGPEFANIQGSLNPRDYFKQVLFKPTYTMIKEDLASKYKGTPMILAQIYNKALTASYNDIIRDPVISKITGENSLMMDKKTIDKIVKSDDYKKNTFEEIQVILDNKDQHSDATEYISDWITRIESEYAKTSF